MKHGDIYYVDFSTSMGHEYKGKRPALIIQADNQLKVTNMVTIMPFTSKTDQKHKDDLSVMKDNTNNLMSDSLLKVHHIKSFDRTRFIKKIGEIDTVTVTKIKKYLGKHFGL